MRATSILACLWPGLPRLWLRGEWKGLAEALAFGAIFNLALVATFVWPQWLWASFGQIAWPVIGVAWVVAAWRNMRVLPELRSSETLITTDEDLFLRAQAEYLSGHWFEAESLLEDLLGDHPNDADAQLMLASLYRHTRRLDEAHRQLSLLERQPDAGKWQLEIHHERKLLAHLAGEEQVGDDEAQPDDADERPSDFAQAA